MSNQQSNKTRFVFGILAMTSLAAIAPFAISNPVNASNATEDVVKLSCSETSGKITSPFGKATATCYASTSPAPSGWAYLKNPNTKATVDHNRSHHRKEKCNIAYKDEYLVDAKLANGTTTQISAFKRVEVHGEAKAKGSGKRAKITCNAQVIRTQVD